MELLLFVCLTVFLFLGFKFFFDKTISIDDAKKELKNGAVILDVRTKEEYSKRHVNAALNVPLADLKQNIEEIVKDKNKSLLVHCQSGVRSKTACKILKEIGYQNVFDVGSLHRAELIVK